MKTEVRKRYTSEEKVSILKEHLLEREEMLLHATEMPSNVELCKGDITDIPNHVKKIKFNLITALAVLEHLINPSEALNQVALLLKEDGLFVATCPLPIWDKLAQILNRSGGNTHFKSFNKNQLIQLLSQSGLEVIDCIPFMWAPFGILPYLKIPVSSNVSIKLDILVRKLHVFNWLFVNHCVMARKRL